MEPQLLAGFMIVVGAAIFALGAAMFQVTWTRPLTLANSAGTIVAGIGTVMVLAGFVAL